MTGDEHYQEAESILKRAEEFSRALATKEVVGFSPQEHAELTSTSARLAQVHATLALAAATAMTGPEDVYLYGYGVKQ